MDSANYYAAKAARGYMHGDTRRRHAYADSARVVVERLARAQPEDAYLTARLAFVYAALGRGPAADAALRREAELRRAQGDTVGLRADLAEQSARVLMLQGKREPALDSVRAMFADSQWFFISPAEVAVNPFWAPLRSLPGFQGLAAAR